MSYSGFLLQHIPALSRNDHHLIFFKTQENFGFLEDWTPEGAKELHNLLLGLCLPNFYGNGVSWHQVRR